MFALAMVSHLVFSKLSMYTSDWSIFQISQEHTGQFSSDHAILIAFPGEIDIF